MRVRAARYRWHQGARALLVLMWLSTELSCQSQAMPKPAYLASADAREVSQRRDAVDFSGSCSWARAPGRSHQYLRRVRVTGGPSSSAPVHSTGSFVGADNIIGRLAAGTRALADGPLYDPDSGQFGYALIVRGSAGRLCRGYLRATDLIEEAPNVP